MIPTTKAVGNKFAPAILINRGEYYDLWVCQDFLLSKAGAYKHAERNAALLGRIIVKHLIEGHYRAEKSKG